MFVFGVWETIFTIIPISILIVLPFWKIFSKAGFSGWWSLFILIPPVNIILIYYFAFHRWRFSERIAEIDNNDIDPTTGNDFTVKNILVKRLFFITLLCFSLFLLFFRFENFEYDPDGDSVFKKILTNFKIGQYQVECNSGACIILNTSNGIVKILDPADAAHLHDFNTEADF